jgi:Glycosyltransferase family 9 (heptosyltransferase)
MKHLVSNIDARARLVIADKRDCVCEGPNDAAVTHVQFGPNSEIGRVWHVDLTGMWLHGSLGVRTADRPQAAVRTEPTAERCLPMPSTVAELPGDDPWMAAMRRNDLAAAWAISDEVLQRHRMSGEEQWRRPRHLQHIWMGQPLAGQRVLVRCYHGLGDTIQFIRFARPLRALARHVIVWTQPALLDLVASAAGVDEALALHDGIPDADYDVDVEIMELPHALRISSIPADIPYLHPDTTGRAREKNGKFTVGLVWEAGGWDRRRDLPIDLLRQLVDVPRVQFICLQAGAAAASASSIPAETVDCSTLNHTAARVRELDLIISVDTMVAHLAGALGRPVWTLLHRDCDWRWGNERSDCVWYPTMQLFRQTDANDWLSVIERVRSELIVATSSNENTVAPIAKLDASAASLPCKEQTLPLPRSAVASDKHFAR